MVLGNRKIISFDSKKIKALQKQMAGISPTTPKVNKRKPKAKPSSSSDSSESPSNSSSDDLSDEEGDWCSNCEPQGGLNYHHKM